MDRAKKEVVWVPLSWCESETIEIINFLCPKCGSLTVRRQKTNPHSSITCKYCRTNFKLDYGYECQLPEEINYPEVKWTMHFPDDIDTSKQNELLK